MEEDEEKALRDVILMLKKQCLVHMFLQSKSASIHNIIHNSLTIPNIMIGGILSITIFSTSNTYWKVTTGALAITSTLLSSLSKHLSSGERSHVHCNAVKDYMSLLQELNVSIPTASSIEEKRKILERVRDSLNKLYDSQPEPSRFAVATFESRYKKNIEEALYDDFEDMTIRSATYVQNRISFVKQKRTSEVTKNSESGGYAHAV